MKKIIDTLKTYLRRVRPNRLNQELRKFKKGGGQNAYVVWNRGLGDVPLGLAAFVHLFENIASGKNLVFITRSDLQEVFQMLHPNVLISKKMKRGQKSTQKELEEELGIQIKDDDLFIDWLDPTRQLAWQIGNYVPRLFWKKEYDLLSHKFSLNGEKPIIAMHIDSETGHLYSYEKNWPHKAWEKLIALLLENLDCEILLFGIKPTHTKLPDRVHDLRGKTTLLEVLSLLKNSVDLFIAPDSGILSAVYYVDAQYPLQTISLWADPLQGILRQKVASPNSLFSHMPMLSPNGDLNALLPEKVFDTAKKCLLKSKKMLEKSV